MDSPESDPISLLTQSFRTSEGPARVNAIRKLQELPQIPAEILGELVEVLKDDDPVVRLEAALVFRRVGADAIPVLIQALGSEELELRRGAASTLGYVGPSAQAAIPALQKAIQDEAIAFDAAEALRKISPQQTWISLVDHFLSQVMPIVLVLAIMLVFVGIIYYVFRGAGQIVIDMAVGFCLIGGSFGGILGGSRWGRRGAVFSAFVFALGAGLVGAGIGYVAGSIFGPVIQSLQLKNSF